MKKLLLTAVTVAVMFVTNQSIAQDKWSLELRPGINYATKDISDADLGLGFGAELTIAYRFMPHLAAYAGWSYNNFAADQSFAGTDASFEETSLVLFILAGFAQTESTIMLAASFSPFLSSIDPLLG